MTKSKDIHEHRFDEEHCDDFLRLASFTNQKVFGSQHAKGIAVAAFSLFLLVASLGKARADSGQPELFLDAGGHTRSVFAIALTADGKQLVSASFDRTVRIWDLETGKSVRMILGENGPRFEALHSMALSPDGRWLALGGRSPNTNPSASEIARLYGHASVRLYDFASGKFEKLLEDPDPGGVYGLAFSPDSKRLTTVGNTIVLWDLASFAPLKKLFDDTGMTDGVAYNHDATKVVTASSGGALRLWRVEDWSLIAEMTGPKTLRAGNKPLRVEALAFSPTQDLIAAADAFRIYLWDARNGEFREPLGGSVDTGRGFGLSNGLSNFRALSFSPDGQRLLSASDTMGCKIYEISSGRELIDGHWQEPAVTTAPPASFDRGERCNLATAFSADGRLAITVSDSKIRVRDGATGEVIRTLESSGLAVNAVGFSPDGQAIAWGYDDSATGQLSKVAYRVALPTNDQPSGTVMPLDVNAQSDPTSETFVRRTTTFGARSIKFSGGRLGSEFVDVFKDDTLSARIDVGALVPGGRPPLSFTPDGQAIIVGGSRAIGVFDLSGKQLGAFVADAAPVVRDLAVSRDGNLLVSGGDDQTVKLWNMKTYELIASMFHGSDQEWVVWTPRGYYASSPNGDRFLTWWMTNGPDHEPAYVTTSQLRSEFHRPDLIEQAIRLATMKDHH